AQAVLKDAVPLFETHYDYDRAGNLTHRRDSVQGVDEYRYDAIGRLLQHTDPKGKIERFFNDPAGDRLATRVQQVQLRKVVGGDDEQQVQWTREGTYDGVHYVFDRAGDLIRKGSPHGPAPDDLELRWDPNHRLTESRKAGQVTHYGYDPLGRRVFKRNPTHTTWFYWDGDALLGEVKHANDDPDAAPIWIGNVANLIEAKRRKEKLAKLHERVREYVYYPGTFVPLALVEKELKQEAADTKRVRTRPDIAAAMVEVDDNASKERLIGSPVSPSVTNERIFEARGDAAGKFPDETDGKAEMGLGLQKSFAESRDKPPPATGSLGAIGVTTLGRDAFIKEMPENRTDSNDFRFPVGARSMEFSDVRDSTDVSRSDNSSKEFFDKSVSSAANSNFLNHPLDFSVPSGVRTSVVYYYSIDPNGRPCRILSTGGDILWLAAYDGWGNAQLLNDSIESNVRLQGQYYDQEIGIFYNRYRFYDAHIGAFLGQDPIGLRGGINIYEYGRNVLGFIDALGLVDERAPGYNVYGLYDAGSDKPYYVGITDDLDRRRAEHVGSGRLLDDETTEIRPIKEDVTYGEARGIEQANIEHHKTKTGVIGQDVSQVNRGNKINSFDVNNKTRAEVRQKYFTDAYKKALKALEGCRK
ncbi:RHS repeat-associated core domain-containing protein, partial [Xanthomonas oryzae]|uniref:RHS repeat-associated core domain-containing protein n=2 Tax=Xanthomonas oryzae TaxID=347 RepID=UPI0015EE8B9F